MTMTVGVIGLGPRELLARRLDQTIKDVLRQTCPGILQQFQSKMQSCN